MRLGWSEAALLMVVCGLGVSAACKGDGCVPVYGAVSCAEHPCASWSSLVTLGPGSLNPDRSFSPPRADITVGQTFHVSVSSANRQPPDCTTALDGPFTYRSTNENVLRARNGVGVNFVSAIYEGVGTGTARVVVDMPTPSGPSEPVELTVCGDPFLDETTCPDRVPLVIRVVSE